MILWIMPRFNHKTIVPFGIIVSNRVFGAFESKAFDKLSFQEVVLFCFTKKLLII